MLANVVLLSLAHAPSSHVSIHPRVLKLACFYMEHACPWSSLACKMGFLIVPGLNLNRTGLCSQSCEVSLPVFTR